MVKAKSQTFFLGNFFSHIDKLYDFAFTILHRLFLGECMKDYEGKIADFLPWRIYLSHRQTLRFCLHSPSYPVLGEGTPLCAAVFHVHIAFPDRYISHNSTISEFIVFTARNRKITEQPGPGGRGPGPQGLSWKRIFAAPP
jgi:hypothetical protein